MTLITYKKFKMKELIKIQSELKAPKNQVNTFGNYKYRSCEDVLEALKPLLAKNGCTLTLTDKLSEASGFPVIEAVATIKSADQEVSVSAFAGVEVNKKGMDVSQTFGSASSYARKYALNGLFLIDDAADADATNTHDDKSTNDKSKNAKPNNWLNKGSEQWDKAVTFLKDGGEIDKIKEKYRISKANEQELKQIVLGIAK